MDDQLLATIEREILSWPGVSKVTMEGGPAPGGFQVPPATVYNLGRRHLGHIHVTGVADITLPRAVCADLIASGKAVPHGAGFAGVVSYHIATPEAIPGLMALFRLSFDRAQAASARHAARTNAA